MGVNDTRDVGLRERGGDGGACGAFGGECSGEGGDLVRREGTETRVILEGPAEDIEVSMGDAWAGVSTATMFFRGLRRSVARAAGGSGRRVKKARREAGRYLLGARAAVRVLEVREERGVVRSEEERRRCCGARRWRVDESDCVCESSSSTGASARGDEGEMQSARASAESHCNARGVRRAPCCEAGGGDRQRN